MPKLAAHLWSHDLDVPHHEVGGVEAFLQGTDYFRLHNSAQVPNRGQNSAPLFVAEILDLLRHRGVTLRSVSAQVHRILLKEVLLQRWRAAVIQVLLALIAGILRLERLDDGVLALVERRFAGFLNSKVYQNLVVRGGTKTLNAWIMQSGAVHVATNLFEIRSLSELDINQRATAELYAQRNAVPKENRAQSGDAEDQRKGKEVPLLAQKIDVGIAK